MDSLHTACSPNMTDSSFQETSLGSSGPQLTDSDTEDIYSGVPDASAPDSRCDSRGVPGWDAVDNLAGYLVSLNRTITALSTKEIAEILRLYNCLHDIDQTPFRYSLKCKKKTLPGPLRASRKRSGSAPGQQAAERQFMTHGQAAQRPDKNRISECVALKLLKEYREPRNRPKDSKGKTFPIPQAIVKTYSHNKQLLEDCRELLAQTNLVLVTINTTVSSWLLDRQKRTDRDTLLQGVELPEQISVAKLSLPNPRGLPTAPVEHGHTVIEFQEPANFEGEAVIRHRKHARTEVSHADVAAPGTSLAHVARELWPGVNPMWINWPGFLNQQSQHPSSPGPSSQGWSSTPPGHYPSAPTALGFTSFLPCPQPSAPQSQNWQRAWRLRKAELEDQELVARGEPPKSICVKKATTINVNCVVSQRPNLLAILSLRVNRTV